MYKCPFCKSTNCEEINTRESVIVGQNQPLTTSINYSSDNYIEFVCTDCGIITKIDPYYYSKNDNN